ncbi:MAG: hypothetical protein U1E76_16765 [Planctomycetota bacterium]
MRPLLILASLGVFTSLAQGSDQPLAALPSPIKGPSWPGYARSSQHDALAQNSSQKVQRIQWTTPVDLYPPYSGGYLLIHYGTPLVTPAGTVIVTVKVGVTGDFQVEGRREADGSLLWTQPTDYLLPAHNWIPSCGSTLTPANELMTPGAGGTVYRRFKPDEKNSFVQQLVFYGMSSYLADITNYNNRVKIDTPITADARGTIYFGFRVSGHTLANLASGIARIDSAGNGSWVSAATVSGDSNIKKVVYNCAPALSGDGKIVYVAVNDSNAAGYLLGLDSQTLALVYKVRLKDVKYNADAWLADDGTASPTVGPDGDVYYGVLDVGNNHSRGWMLHFDATLTQKKIPGAFGWDDTASIVPAGDVPSYAGSSSYLVLTKYNNYAGAGGDGVNRLAVLDPNATEVDPISGATVMNEVLTVVGPTPDPDHRDAQHPDAVREWCINTAVVDHRTRAALVNNEDGNVYRWDFATNSLTQVVALTSGIGEAYTPTLVGTQGTVFAINNAILFAVGE